MAKTGPINGHISETVQDRM